MTTEKPKGRSYDSLYAAAQALADGMPNGTVVTVPGSGHFAALDQPAEMARLTTLFLTGDNA